MNKITQKNTNFTLINLKLCFFKYMEPILSVSFFLSAGDANAEGTLSLTSLTTKIIEVATEHANRLHIGNPDMKHLNIGWVLSRVTIEMSEYPHVNDTYILKTWIEDFNRHFSTRCFSITSADGNILGYARTIWMLMDASNHTNYGLSHINLPRELILGESAPIKKQEKHIPILPAGSDISENKKSLISTADPYYYKFKYCDLDFYRHVNTVRYVAMLMNQFSLEEHDNFFVERLEISFLHEASYGMQTTLLRSDNPENPLSSAFQLSDNKTGNALLYARINRKSR